MLAWSTVSQIGYMFLAVGLGGIAYALGIIHLLAHGFFKAGLFLGAGSVMHAMDDQVDIRRFGGLWRLMPITWATFGLAWLAILGIPPLSGFFTKDPIILAAFDRPGWTGWLFGGAALVGAGLTAFYMTRLFVLTFHGPKRWTEGQQPHESPPVMWVPLVLLAVGTVASGALMSTSVVDWLTPVFGDQPEGHGPLSHAQVTAMTMAVVLVGGGSAWALFRKGTALTAAASRRAGDRGRGQPLHRRLQRSGVREAGPVAHPGTGVRGQQGRGRSGQRARRRGRGWLRPDPTAADRLRPLVRDLHIVRCGADRGRLPRAPGWMVDMSFPYLSVLTLAPLAGAGVVAVLPRRRPELAKRVAFGWSLGVLALTVATWVAFEVGGDRLQLRESYPWIPRWGVNFTLATDGIALVMLMLIGVLVPLVILASWHDADRIAGTQTKRVGARACFARLLG